MNPTQQIWLIRHGETAWSLSGQHTGRTDLPLLPEAIPKIQALKPHLQHHVFPLVLSSPLQRARKTAELVGFPSFEMDDNLMEWNYGLYDGKTKDEIKELVPGWSIWKDGVPNGETLEEVAARARAVISRAEQVDGNVALVAHGHILRIIAACWIEAPPIHAEHLALSTAAISILGYENDLPVLTQWNWQPQ